MSPRTGLAVIAGLICAGAVAFIAVSAATEPQPHPTPPRVYSSCLAADTKPMPLGDDPCDGR
ncbi:hypothetical protein [Streptomyces sp. WAC04114]|uniref:hypothetical protein n=1 Tax=Streptomyces sp. WAC04114 TaxID=2867961 RepID=UPI001C8C9781|nr:hypothetical protein [Streptomyces sp. WAC04114]MBX9366021.1 hypothetical protein [Streptomyces sp. WAC04114]